MTYYPNLPLQRSPLKRRMLMAFVVLFSLTPITPALARTSAGTATSKTKPAVTQTVSSPTKTTTDTTKTLTATPTKDTTPPTDTHNIQTPDSDTPPKEDPKDGTDPHKGEPSKEDPGIMPLTSVNPSALSTNLTPSTIKTLLPEADASTGALLYSYLLTLPQGRNGLAPNLSLQYNNQQTQDASFIGHGWSLSIPSIERLNKIGTGGIYTTPYFSSSASGELTLVSPDHYAGKVEDGSFLEYTLLNNVWSVRDKNGTTYTYGGTANARKDNPLDSAQVFSWMLSEVRDLNDNFLTFTYDKDAGEIYPASILYTGHGTNDGIFEVNFIREARPDVTTSYRSAFAVTMNDRLSAIEISTNTILTRRYDLDYSVGDNTVRSLLSSITETGYDANNVATSLPPVTISYETTDAGWTANSTWESPVAFAMQYSSCNSLGSRVADINGDGLPDILKSQTDGSTLTQSVYINNGSGWTLDPNWIIPRAFGYTGWCFGDYGSEVVDINGDALADIIHYQDMSSAPPTHEVYLNTGSGWVQDFNWHIPRALRHDWGDWGTRMADVNGDGLPDFVWSKGATQGVALNTGSDWVIDPTWTVPIEFTLNSLYVRGTEIQDINGDGLADIIEANTGPSPFQQAVYINTGSSWVLDPSWSFPAPLRVNNFADYGTRLVDFNGDGLLDVLVGRTMGIDTFEAYLNTGFGWISAPEWIPLPSVFAVGGYGTDPGVRLIDIDGDGMVDFVKSLQWNSSLIHDTWLANGSRSDRITEVTTSSGGTTNVSYLTPQQMTDGPTLLNPETPFVFDVVSSIERNDGFNTISSYDYAYEGGVYDFDDFLNRKFASFHTRTATDTEGNQTVDFFHQGNATDTALGEVDDHISKLGRSYRTEIHNATGDLMQTIVNAWERNDLGNGVNFVKLAQTLRMDYDGNTDHRDSAVSYTYDSATGNPLNQIEWGEVTGSADGSFVDVLNDDRTTTYTYAENIPEHLLGLPSQITTTDATGALLSDTIAYYDNLPFGSVNIGNETQKDQWVTGTDYVSTERVYDAFGFLVSEWDALGRLTQYTPDVNELYVAETINALGHQTSAEYDLDSGNVTQMIDPNGRTTQTIYDGLNRPVTEWKNTTTSLSQMALSATHAYAPQSIGTQTIDTVYFDDVSSQETISYTDGFDRARQSRREMQDAGTYAVTDTTYDTRERIASQSLPYASSGTARTAPTTTIDLLTTFTYDALGRTQSLTTAVGTSSTTYDQWNTVVTDARGIEKGFQRDANNQLTAVTEHEGLNTFVTTYDYDLAGNLIELTDALNNVRHFTYDGLGRRLTSEDLHAPSDATFGTWSSIYDDAGNLTSQTDPRGETLTWVYDELNRPLMEHTLSDPEAHISYTYDLCPNGIGLPCETGTPAISQVAEYDMLGQPSAIMRFLEGGVFYTTYENDRAGRVLLTTYPDSSQVQNIYDDTGYLEAIQQKEATASVFTPIVSSIDYTPIGKRGTITLANGTTTTNTYDASELYRLRARETVGPTGALQQMTYTYDANGNVTSIVDTSNTNTAKTTTYLYDDLNRLVSATVSGSANNDDSTQTYTYNALGDLLARSDVGAYLYEGDQNASYANPHAATSINGDTLTYDESGNVTSVENVATYVWNAKNELVNLAPLPSSSLPTASFTYDTNGIRTKSVIGTNVTIYPIGGFRYENDVINKEISLDDGEAVASIEGSGDDVVIRFTHTDHLTGAGVVTDLSGSPVQVLDYHPFGTERLNEQTSDFDAHRKFAGHEFNDDIGLSYMLARYYNPSTGTFLSQDPAFVDLGDASFKDRYGRSLEQHLQNPQALNSYAYALNNPLTYRDPQGEIVPLAGIIAAWPSIISALAFITTPVGVAMLAQDTEALTNPNSSNVTKVIAGVSLIGSVTPIGATDDAARASGLANNAIKGKVGEIASGIVKNTERIPSLSGTALYRIPDALNTATKTIGEVKNVTRQSLTRQLNDFISYAQKTKSQFTLYTRENTHLSQPLQNALNQSKSILKKILQK